MLRFICAFALLCTYAAAGNIQPHYLRCEYRVDPLGIDDAKPRLSWIVTSKKNAQRQTAYRILVASSPDKLAANTGDLWDSGTVNSDNTTAIVYAGKSLKSQQWLHWKVRVWDATGQPSTWSKPAHWSMGLLKPSDWKAEWIGYDKPRFEETTTTGGGNPFAAAKWIWWAGEKGKATAGAPACTRYFSRKFNVTGKADKASLTITADDWFVVALNGKKVGASKGKDAWKKPRQIDLRKHLREGANNLTVEVRNEAPSPCGLLAAIVLTTGGNTTNIISDKKWTSSGTKDGKYSPARELGKNGIAPWKKVGGKGGGGGLTLPPVRCLRKEFSVDKPIKRAVLYTTALAIHEVRLNGKRVSEHYFNPGWTDYTKRIYYRAYDVTTMLNQGPNAIGAMLAGGWYSGYIGYRRQRDHYGKKLRLKTQIVIELKDGTRQVVATNKSWKVATGPIREADFLHGETYDARSENPGWDKPGFDDSKWNAPDSGSEISPAIQAAPHQGVKVFQELKPKKISQPRPGLQVADFGTNFAGFVRLRVQAPAGTKIVLKFAERLNPDGTAYTRNLRSARATDTYICKGGGIEIFEPRFTYHGFQYAQVDGYPTKLNADAITGIELTSAAPVVGAFASNDPMLNQLYHNIRQTQRSNFIDIPTDCPQRDERLGWTGDAQVYVRTATYNNDIQAFFKKWLVDLTDAQRGDGQFPMVAPLKVAGGDGGPAWSDAGTICPWTIYQAYGDRQAIAKHYDAMKKFVEFCHKRCGPGPLPPRKFHCFGDWLSIGAKTPKDVIYMAYFANSTRNLYRAAEVLGKSADAEKYKGLWKQIKTSFNKAYVQPDGKIKGHTQCVYVLAIVNDLLDPPIRKKAADHLIERVKSKNWHLSTGFIGTKDLMGVLSRIGRTDVAYRLIHNDTFPSWGFSVKHGATSIWERWNGWTPEKGFGNPGMNSFAHYSFGAVYQWMFESIGGIHTMGPGYKKIRIAPQPGGKLTWAKVSYNSIRGPIKSEWSCTGNALSMTVAIPPNTTATVHVPGGDKSSGANGAKFVKLQDGNAVFEIASGTYTFRGKVK